MPAHLPLEKLVQALQSHLRPVLEPSSKNLANSVEAVHEIEEALCSPCIILFIYGDHRTGDKPAALAPARQGGSADTAFDLDLHKAATFSVSILNRQTERKEDAEVVIDEFDHVADGEERARFANFVKQISERRVPVHFVLCGVSEALKALLSAHESSYCFDDVSPAGRGNDVTLESISSTAEALRQSTPHYVHLLSEELFWEMLDEPTFARNLH
jgi:hypothetical protein